VQDQILDWAVVALPTLLSLWGVLVTLEPPDKKHKTKWRVALFLGGIFVSGLTYRQQASQRARAHEEAHEFLEHVVEQERLGAAQFNALTEKFNAFVALHPRQERLPAMPKPPSAEEIAAEVSKQLKGSQPATSSSTPPAKSPANTTTVVPAPVPPIVAALPQPTVCRGDRLSECSDEQLLAWGKPLVAKVQAIEDDYMADLKKLDDIKAGNWLGEALGEIVGIGNDKTSRRLKAHAQAEEKVADYFRNCCAEDALAYHKELKLRTGGGLEKTDDYEWATNLLKPPKSKEFKNARQDNKIIGVVYDLQSLQSGLQIAQIEKRIHQP